MIPAQNVKLGDVVALAGTPVKYAQPVAEVNFLDNGVELVFIEKSLHAEAGIRAAGNFHSQHPVALMCDVDDRINEVVELWLASAHD
jgi:hypothetical protein